MRQFCLLFLLFTHPCIVGAFTSPSQLGKGKATYAALHLVPIAKFSEDMTFLWESEYVRCCLDKDGRLKGDEDDQTYTLGIIEKEDLSDVSKFVIQAFGADVISLATDLNMFEKVMMEPAVGLLNAYSGLVAYKEVLSGLESRTKDRMDRPDVSPPSLMGSTRNEKITEAQTSSLVLALARESQSGDSKIDVIASIELRLQPCDAKIPFTLPWLDNVERRLAAAIGMQDTKKARDLRPYLSNLGVDENYRGRKIGKALVRCVENIAATAWGYNKMYLHVDLANLPALNLYRGEGYTDVGQRWNPFWAGKAAEIGYFVKDLP